MTLSFNNDSLAMQSFYDTKIDLVGEIALKKFAIEMVKNEGMDTWKFF